MDEIERLEIERLEQEIAERKAKLYQLTRPRSVFAERLKAAREKAGLTRKELGDAINISPAGYAYYERGQRDPSLKSLVALANTLGVSLDWLCGRTNEPKL